MKPPDRLLDDISVFKFMAKFWIGLPIALIALLWMVSSASGRAGFHPWDSMASAAGAIADALLPLLVAIVGGKFFVTLFQTARRERPPR